MHDNCRGKRDQDKAMRLGASWSVHLGKDFFGKDAHEAVHAEGEKRGSLVSTPVGRVSSSLRQP